MPHGNDELFSEPKWYLVSPINTDQWSSVVADWESDGAASGAVFHRYIYKLHQPVANDEILTRASWDQIDISGSHDDLERGVGYFVYVEQAGTVSTLSSVLSMDETGSIRSQSRVKLYSLETKDTYIELKKEDGSTIDEVTDEIGNVTITDVSFPKDKMVKIEFEGGVSDDTIVPNDTILKADEDIYYNDEDVEQKRIIIVPLESIIDSSNNNKPIVANSIRELASELFLTNINNYDNVDTLKTKLEDSKNAVATTFDINKEDIDKKIEETTDTGLLDGIRKLKILQDTFIALDEDIDNEEIFDERNKKILQIKKGIVNTIKDKGGTQIDFSDPNDIDILVEKVYDDSSSDLKLELDNRSYTSSEKETVKTNKKSLIKAVFDDLDADVSLNDTTIDKSEKEMRFKIKEKEWKAKVRKQRKLQPNKETFEKLAPVSWQDPGVDLKPVRDDEKNNIQCLLRQTTGASSEDNIINVINSKYEFNDVPYDDDNKIALGRGEYIIKGVPQTHPIAFILRKQRYYNRLFTIVSGNTIGGEELHDDVNVQHYYGDIRIKVSGNFGRASYRCYYHGYMGGENKLIYSNKCNILATPGPSITVVLNGSATGTADTNLKSNENVDLHISGGTPVDDKYVIFWEISNDSSSWSRAPSGHSIIALTDEYIGKFLRAVLTVNTRDGFSLKLYSNIREIEASK